MLQASSVTWSTGVAINGKQLWRIDAEKAISSRRVFARDVERIAGNDDGFLSMEEYSSFVARKEAELQQALASGQTGRAESAGGDLEAAAKLLPELTRDTSLLEDILRRKRAPIQYETFRDTMEDLFGARLPPNP